MDLLILASSQGKNLELGKTLKDIAKKTLNVESTVVDLVELQLPLYDQNKEEEGIPEKAIELKDELIKAKRIIVLAPEYNGGVPPVLTNTFSWISRTSEDWREAFNYKKAVIGTHSGGGGQYVLMALRTQLSYMGVNVMGRSILTNYAKPLKEESAQEILAQLFN